MGQQVVAAAVDGFLGDDVAAVGRQGLDGVGDGCCAGGQRQCRAAAFQGRYSLFQDVLGGVGQPAVDVAGVRQSEAVGCVLAVMEYVRGGLVDGDCPGVAGRVRLFLSDV